MKKNFMVALAVAVWAAQQQGSAETNSRKRDPQPAIPELIGKGYSPEEVAAYLIAPEMDFSLMTPKDMHHYLGALVTRQCIESTGYELNVNTEHDGQSYYSSTSDIEAANADTTPCFTHAENFRITKMFYYQLMKTDYLQDPSPVPPTMGFDSRLLDAGERANLYGWYTTSTERMAEQKTSSVAQLAQIARQSLKKRGKQ